MGQTALQLGKPPSNGANRPPMGQAEFGKKLKHTTIMKFGNMLSNLTSDHRFHSKQPRQEVTRGKNGSSYPAPRFTHNVSSTCVIPGSNKPLFRQGPATPPFVDNETVISNIMTNLDPASNDFLCEIGLPDSNATFASGTHALAFTQAVLLDLGPGTEALPLPRRRPSPLTTPTRVRTENNNTMITLGSPIPITTPSSYHQPK